MVDLLETKGVVCRPCGAVYAQPSENGDMCISCYKRYNTWLAKEKPTDLNKNKWLASVLAANLTRQKKFGVCGRCEAITQTSTLTHNAYYQCAAYASRMKDGRRLCPSHAEKADHLSFVDNVVSAYIHLENIISDLARMDDRLKCAIERGLNK